MTTTLTRRINDAALPVCLAAMDACSLYAVAWLFSTIVLSAVALFPVPEPPMLAGLELAAWWFTRLVLDRTKLAGGSAQLLVGVAGVAACVLVTVFLNPFGTLSVNRWVATAIYGLLVSLLSWGIGGYRASERPDFGSAYATFRLGLVVVSLAAFMASLLAGNRISTIWASLGGLAVFFFAWSLAALALGNREVVRAESGDARTRFWGPVLVVSMAVILLLGTGTGTFGAQNLVSLAQQAIGGALLLVGMLIYWVLYAIFWLMSLVQIRPHLPHQSNVTPTPTPAPQATSDWLRQLQQNWDNSTPDRMSPALQALFMAVAALLIVLVVAWMLSRGVRRTGRERVKNNDEERESLGSWALLVAQLRAFVQRLLARLFPGKQAPEAQAEDDLALLRGRPELTGTLSVRQIYARLQWLAASAGYPRAPQQTPAEYLGVLAGAMPAISGDLGVITSAYMEARYGPLPATAPSVEAATTAWQRAEATLKGMKAKG